MGDEHLDIIPTTKSDEVIKSSVEDLVPIPSESEGIPKHMCDVPFHDNSPPLDISPDQIEDFSESNNEVSSIDDDSFSIDKIDYVEASPHDSELVSLEAAEIVIPEVEEIEDDNLREQLLNVHLLIANIEALQDNPTQSSELLTKDLPDQGELMSVLNSRIRKNLPSATLVNLPIEDDHSPLLAYVVWIFVAYLTYPVIPPYLHPFGNENTIFDPCITINHFYSSKPISSHRHGAFKKINTHRSHLNVWPMTINGKNTPILDVLLFHFYPP
nr:hypothetical protein [Tanacetum cinerariifolium]